MSDPGNGPSDDGGWRRVQITDEIDDEQSIVASDDGLVAWTREQFGEDLRSVCAYDDYTFELLYVDEEVRAQYTEQELAAVGEEFSLSTVKEDAYLEELYHLGEFEYVASGFEDGLVIRIPIERPRGLIVSVTSAVEVTLPAFVDRLERRHDVEFR